jgi:hypothetical protein
MSEDMGAAVEVLGWVTVGSIAQGVKLESIAELYINENHSYLK